MARCCRPDAVLSPTDWMLARHVLRPQNPAPPPTLGCRPGSAGPGTRGALCVLPAASAAPDTRAPACRFLRSRRRSGDPQLLGFFWTAAHFVMVTAAGLEVHTVLPSLQGLRLASALPLQASRRGVAGWGAPPRSRGCGALLPAGSRLHASTFPTALQATCLCRAMPGASSVQAVTLFPRAIIAAPLCRPAHIARSAAA